MYFHAPMRTGLSVDQVTFATGDSKAGARATISRLVSRTSERMFSSYQSGK